MTSSATGAVAATSLLTGSPLQSLFEAYTPGFSSLHSFFLKWLHIDITKLAMAVTICAMLSGAISNIGDMATRFYWWIARFLTASISITAKDRLNREVINWLSAHVLRPKRTGDIFSTLSCSETRTMIACSSETFTQNDAFIHSRCMEIDDSAVSDTSSASSLDRPAGRDNRRAPVHYLPTFGISWFRFEGKLFLVRRVNSGDSQSQKLPFVHEPYSSEYQEAATGAEPLVIMCLGRSIDPIKRFLNACQEFTAKQAEKYVTVRTVRGRWRNDEWDVTILRPRRSLDSVYISKEVKESLIQDITTYLLPSTRNYYISHGIPYRRGYLFHGPPGTGKTSLSFALAAHFNIPLHVINLQMIQGDSDLEVLFIALPPRCIVLLEDIDCICMKRRRQFTTHDPDDGGVSSSSESEDERNHRSYFNLSLSGLLNVLDGVISQEGRIVVMTSNMPEKLDEALVRPGRIDRKVHLGLLSHECASEMFFRMYTDLLPTKAHVEEEDHFFGSDSISRLYSSFTASKPQEHWTHRTLNELASDFAQAIPEEKLSPALVQGFLLDYKHSPFEAVRAVRPWVDAEMKRLQIAEDLKQRSQEKKQEKMKYRRQNRKLNVMQRDLNLKQSMKDTMSRMEEMARSEEKELRKKEAIARGEHVSSSSSSSPSDSSSDSDSSPKKHRKHKKRKDGKKKNKRNTDVKEGKNEDSDCSTKGSSSAPKDLMSPITPASTSEPEISAEVESQDQKSNLNVPLEDRQALVSPETVEDVEAVPEKLISVTDKTIAEEQKPTDYNIASARLENAAQATPQPEIQSTDLLEQEPVEQGAKPGQEARVLADNERRNDQINDDVERPQSTHQVKERLQKIDEEPENVREQRGDLKEAESFFPSAPATPASAPPSSVPSSLLEVEDNAGGTPPLPSPVSQTRPHTPPRLLGKLPLLRRHASVGGSSADSTKSPRRLSANFGDVVGSVMDFRSLSSSRRNSNASMAAVAVTPSDPGASRNDMAPAPTSSAEAASSPHERVQPHLHNESRIAASGAEEKVKDEKPRELVGP
ncbi:Mitochondrial chaperone BCS1 [Ceratocystis fimbriata CBS 114723]|uniref:Mitochondrial chaperone BCS1 n=1 Tax=Ceratocystis fimbriata CBS 114723 TaxID=1035309 RepID=A0A2C5X2T3_9PEZI|nr:Mitochondrial chaperone BCS1 [Ceratocystis fimbriata CBS 114723]